MVAAKTPTLSLHNSLEPPLDYIPVNSANSAANIQSSKISSGSKPVSSNFPGPGYLHPLCPNGKAPPCDSGPPPPKPPPDQQTCPNGKPPPCECPKPLIGTPPNCRADKYLPLVRVKVDQCPR